MKESKRSPLSVIYTVAILLFFYTPIFIVMLYSFNTTKGFTWTGFSFKWYTELVNDRDIIESLINTGILALVSSALATIIGTIAAMGVFSLKNKMAKNTIRTLTYIPLLNPEIVTGISFMLLFVAVRFISFGWPTLIIAHVSFCVPSVYLSVLPKLRQINKNAYEAALDLGCNPFKAFIKVVIPEIFPGIMTGFLMALTYSIDDFVISHFTAGDVKTLPITIYSMTRRQISPKINALSTIMFLVVLLLSLFINLRAIKKEKDKEKKLMYVQRKG